VDTFRVHHDLRSIAAASQARGLEDLDFIDQSLSDQLVLQAVEDFVGAAVQALRIYTYQNMRAVILH
jgi:hypothetical protein